MRWDRLTVGIGLSYSLLAWSIGFGPVLPQLRDDLHMSASVAALHGSMFGVLLLILATSGRRVLGRLSNRTLLTASVVGMMSGGALFGFGRTAALTLLGAAIASTGAACLLIVVPTVIYAHHPSTPTEAMSMLNAFPMVSSALLPAAVGLTSLLDISWRIAYLAPMLAIAISVLLISARSTVPVTQHAEPVAVGQLFRVPTFGRRWAVLVCGVLVELAVGSWAASILVERGGTSKGLGSTLTLAFFVGMTIGRLSLAHVLRRHSQLSVLIASFVGVLVSLVPFMAGPGLIGRVVGLFLFGLTLSSVYPLAIGRMFELHHDTEALGRAAAIASGVGGTFGPFLLGALSDIAGFGWATLLLPVFTLAGLAMARPRETPTAAPVL